MGTLHERTILLKIYQNARSFFLSHTSKLKQQKQWDVVSKSTTKIDPSNKYNIFPSFIIDQSWNTLQLKILCWASAHPLSQSLPFLHLQVCDQKHYRIIMAYSRNNFNCFINVLQELKWNMSMLLSKHIAFDEPSCLKSYPKLRTQLSMYGHFNVPILNTFSTIFVGLKCELCFNNCLRRFALWICMEILRGVILA